MSSSSLGETRFYTFLIFACLVLTGKTAENFGVSFLGDRNIDTSHLLGCTLSWMLNSLSTMAINLFNGVIYVILFVFTVAIFLSVWESVLSCFFTRKTTQPVVVSYPRTVGVCVQTLSENAVYQYSPTGKKSDGIIYGGRPITPNLTEEEEESPDASLLIRVSTFFIRIYYGPKGKKIALIDRTVYKRPQDNNNNNKQDEMALLPLAPLVEYSYSGHEFEVEPTAFLDKLGSTLKNLPNSNELSEKAKTYNEKRPLTLYRQEFEFASGHKIVKKHKIKTTLSRI